MIVAVAVAVVVVVVVVVVVIMMRTVALDGQVADRGHGGFQIDYGVE